MQLVTSTFGEISIKDEDVIRFPVGIPGFPDDRQFVILQPDPEVPISYLQSIESTELSFIIVNPFVFYEHYEFKLSESEQEALNISNPREVAVYSLVTVKDSLQNATLNLIAPIVINTSKRVGKQVVLNGTEYQTKHPLLPHLKSKTEEGKPCSF